MDATPVALISRYGGRVRCRVRNIVEADEAALHQLDALFERARGNFLPQPDMQDICDAAEEGLLYVVEAGGPKTTIVGAAGLFPIADASFPHSPEAVKVYELAGMVLDKPYGGFGLQRLLVALRVVALARGEAENVCVVCSIDSRNERSLKNVEAGHLTRCDSPPWMRSVHRSWCTNDAGVVDLIVPSCAVARHAEFLIEFNKSPVLRRTNRDTQAEDELGVDIDVAWAKDTQVLEAMTATGAVTWPDQIPPDRKVHTSSGWVTLRSAR